MRPTVKADDEPRPVPPGISAIDAISIPPFWRVFSENGPKDRMLDLIGRGDKLCLRIFQMYGCRLEIGVSREIHAFVDRNAQGRARIAAVKAAEVRSAAEEADAKRCLRRDHARTPSAGSTAAAARMKSTASPRSSPSWSGHSGGAAIPAAVARLHADRPKPHPTGREHVASAVSHAVGFRQRDVPVRRCLFEHSSLGLAAVANDFQLRGLARKAIIGMVGAISDVDPGMPASQQRFHLEVNAPQSFRGAFDPRLIGDDDDEKSRLDARFDGLKIESTVEMARIVRQEHCRSPEFDRAHSLCIAIFRQRFC
jgi:hypothetical protein